MGRKKWWRGGLELLVLSILYHTVLSDGNVGCLFSSNVCIAGKESCYNDLAFGKCISHYGKLNDQDVYQYDLNVEELELLKLQLEKLEIDGYEWSHPYTQCIMQSSLYNLRHSSKYDLRLCQPLKDWDGHRFKEQDIIEDEVEVPAIAIVKFAPNDNDPNRDFTEELYYPARTQDQFNRHAFDNREFYLPYTEERGESAYQVYKPRYSSHSHNFDSINSFVNNEKIYPEKKLHKKSVPLGEMDRQSYPTNRLRYNLNNYKKNDIEFLKDALEDEKLLREPIASKNFRLLELTNDDLRSLSNEKFPSEDSFHKRVDVDTENGYERTFSRKYKHPKRFSNIEFLGDDWPSVDDVERSSNQFSKGVDYEIDNDNVKIAAPRTMLSSKEKGIYGEGGVIQPSKYVKSTFNNDKNDDTYEDTYNDDLDALLWRRELAGFKRRERLDVKKPGPPFSTNNYAFKTQFSPTFVNENLTNDDQQNDVLFSPFVKKELSNAQKLEKATGYKNVDLDHVYIEFQQEFHTWPEGNDVVTEVGKLLGLPPGTLKDIRVGRAEVTFKVTPNNKNYNATDVVNSIDEIRGKLRENLGFEVVRAGIGDKAKLPATLEVSTENEMSSSLFYAIVAAGVAAVCAAAVVTLIIARRHAKSRAKLAGLTTPDPEASKDYQDLCRARMQAKQPTEKPESPRVTNLSRESESNNMPSNRSSTSSWGEEPTLSNMDISTGHMVLSYMEDHLKNKDRLDQEWAALCAYEADPSSTEIAESEANAKQNRPGAALPYDHSRIVLNDLTNANNSDYINASTITDHDPRNPAYIATQGPLPQTTADFWQLVWEQGSVVIVMLTRLTEEGHAMCHRYWPEEGSELYHIYEVHLVSEHFWCDDYLVRSFYLKNLRTGETRTVTQFHFLSWPENNVPHSTKALLEFRRKVNKSYRGRSCPIVVHCSDGAGRTGTYCLIDMVLNRMMKGAKEIDIAATLEHIRDQRPDMVATKQQFEFVLMAVAEEVHAILKALPIPPTEKSSTVTGSAPTPPVNSDQ